MTTTLGSLGSVSLVGQFMQPLQLGVSPLDQLYPNGAVHIGNLDDEYIDGSEGGLSDHSARSDLSSSISRYGVRMMGTVSNGHAVLVHQPVHQASLAIARYHREHGLNDLKDEAIISVPVIDGRLSTDAAHESVYPYLRERLASLPNSPQTLFPFIQSKYTTDGYYMGATGELRPGLANVLGLRAEAKYESVEMSNHKGVGLEGLREFGVSVPDGRWVHNLDGARQEFMRLVGALELFGKDDGQSLIFAKLVRAASGMGVKALANEADFDRFMDWDLAQAQVLAPGFGLRFDAGIQAASFPNVMVYVGRTAAEDRFITASDQVLKKKYPNDAAATVHCGNRGPVDVSMMRMLMPEVTKIADWHREIGAFGLLGIDFMIERDTNRVVWLENNFRVNGNNHAAFMAIRLGAQYWAASNTVSFPATDSVQDALSVYVGALKLRGLHYNPKTREGVFLNNPAVARDGKLQIGVVSDDPNKRDYLFRTATELFSG